MAGIGAVRRAVNAELRALGIDPKTSGLGAVAQNLATQQDGADSPRAAASVARELRAVLVQLAKGAGPAQQEGDVVDDLSRKRAERRSS